MLTKTFTVRFIEELNIDRCLSVDGKRLHLSELNENHIKSILDHSIIAIGNSPFEIIVL